MTKLELVTGQETLKYSPLRFKASSNYRQDVNMSSHFRGVKQPAGVGREESVCAVGNGREAYTHNVIAAGKEHSAFDGPADPYHNVLCRARVSRAICSISTVS